MGFSPSPADIKPPIEERWRALYANALEGGLGSEVGIGRSMTLWRTIDFSAVSDYELNRMEEPAPFAKVIHAGDVVMEPVTNGPNPLPATWWTKTG